MPLVVIDGLDGAGKTVQLRLLEKLLREELNIPYRLLDFPRYQEDSSALLRKYLSGEYGKVATDLNPYATSTFYAVDRLDSYLEPNGWKADYDDGVLLIANRYTTSNMIYQGAKLPVDERLQFATWLEVFEYDRLRLPRPDMVIILDVTPEASKLLRVNREKTDIHESDDQYLLNCYHLMHMLTIKYKWNRINCVQTHSHDIRSRNDIHRDIVDTMEPIIAMTRRMISHENTTVG